MISKRVYKKLGRSLIFVGLNLCLTILIIWVAYNNRTRIKKMLDHENSFSKEDKVILYDIFSSDLAENKANLVFPAVKNSDELVNDLNKSSLDANLDPVKIYDSCKIISMGYYQPGIIRIKYFLFGDTLDSYAYENMIHPGGKKTTTAVMHIPGSGDNRPGKVARRLMSDEDPTVQAQQIGADIYFPVFPADDILAIHDGTKMLDFKKVISYMITIRRNFSLRYVADVFALEKWLRTQYTRIHIWGHSRGGSTAIIAASICLPDTLIVSSGYSVMNYKFFRLNYDQFWWPGASQYYDKSVIKQRLGNSNTKCFFLFGNKELDDIYGLEARYFYSQKYFKDVPNIHISYANKKHVWFGDEISKILSGN